MELEKVPQWFHWKTRCFRIILIQWTPSGSKCHAVVSVCCVYLIMCPISYFTQYYKHVVHVWTKTSISLFKVLKKVKFFFFIQRSVFSYTCVTCSELRSNMGAMAVISRDWDQLWTRPATEDSTCRGSGCTMSGGAASEPRPLFLPRTS